MLIARNFSLFLCLNCCKMFFLHDVFTGPQAMLLAEKQRTCRCLTMLIKTLRRIIKERNFKSQRKLLKKITQTIFRPAAGRRNSRVSYICYKCLPAPCVQLYDGCSSQSTAILASFSIACNFSNLQCCFSHLFIAPNLLFLRGCQSSLQVIEREVES